MDGEDMPAEDVDVTEGYGGSSNVESVDNFKDPTTSRIVQVISMKRNPVYAVLQFRSCVLFRCVYKITLISLQQQPVS
jgi:hypothetical protein